MAERLTIARPYAVAAFDHAKSQRSLDLWSHLLKAAAVAVATPELLPLLSHPRLDRDRLANLIAEVAGGGALAGGANFMRMLARNGRLTLLPEIAALFERLRWEHENRAEVHVKTARDLSAAQLDLIAKAMRRRLDREVSIVVELDEQLLGGAVVSVGDRVIDGSVLGRLERLRVQLQH